MSLNRDARTSTARRCATATRSLITPDTVYDYDMQHRTEGAEEDRAGARRLRRRELRDRVRARAGARRQAAFPCRSPIARARRATAPRRSISTPTAPTARRPTRRSTSEWVSLLDRGFVVAIAHIRGGQELGRAVVRGRPAAATRRTPSRISSTSRATSCSRATPRSDKVVAEGGSAGGLLMGAVANMAPQDYRVHRRLRALRRRRHDDARRDAFRSPPTSSTSGAIPRRRRTTTTCCRIRPTTT